MLLIATLFISFSNAENAVGFGQNTDDRWWCWFSHCNKMDQQNTAYNGNPMQYVNTGGTGGITHVGAGCTVAECVADGWNPGECEDKDGWYCLPYTIEAKRCDSADGCEKNVNEWSGDGICDFEKCGNCHGFWKDGIFDSGDCKASEMFKKEPAQDEGYKSVTDGELCAGYFYLKGFKWSSKDDCEKKCDERDGCDSFCWSDKSPEWDCLLYRSCATKSRLFNSGSPTTPYKCYQKPKAASMITDVTQPVTADLLMPKFFAFIGILSVSLYLIRSFVKPLKSTEVPTETTPFETTNEI